MLLFQHTHTNTTSVQTRDTCALLHSCIYSAHTRTSLTLRRKSFSGTKQEVFQTSLCAHSINSQQSSQLPHAGAAVSRTIRAGKLCQRKIAAHPPRPRSSQQKFPSLCACMYRFRCVSLALFAAAAAYVYAYVYFYVYSTRTDEARTSTMHDAWRHTRANKS